MNFVARKVPRNNMAAGGRAPAPPARPATPEQTEGPPRPNIIGTAIALMCIALGMLTLNGNSPSEMAAYAARFTGIGIAISFAFDLRAGIANVIRADAMAILAYYFLTFFEFLFPQRMFNTMASMQNTPVGIQIVLAGFIGLLVGRHIIHPGKQPFQRLLTHQIPAKWVVIAFWASFCIGYFHQWASPFVNFDFGKWLDFSMRARFEQPWGRGRYGDWHALLYELNMLINLVPPLYGIMLARRHRYGPVAILLATAGFSLTLFLAFAGGTRNVLATFLITFLIAHAFASPRDRKREVLVLASICGTLLIAGTILMINFRTVGLKRWLSGAVQTTAGSPQSFYVDYNLYSVCKLSEVFPDQQAFLGSEVFYLAVIRPIPRAIWPGKPEGLSNSIERALGFNRGNVTISASFAGEAYMAGGIFAVLLVGLAFGAINGWWSHLASPRNSELGVLIYASGFFAAVISMRSLFTYTTALLPTVGAIIIGTFLVRYLVRQAKAIARANRSRHANSLVRQRPSPPHLKPPDA